MKKKGNQHSFVAQVFEIGKRSLKHHSLALFLIWVNKLAGHHHKHKVSMSLTANKKLN
jgi:hypothetical protein